MTKDSITEEGIIYCPYCHFPHEDGIWEIPGLSTNGDNMEMQCESCRKEFHVSLEVIWKYTSTKLEKVSEEDNEDDEE